MSLSTLLRSLLLLWTTTCFVKCHVYTKDGMKCAKNEKGTEHCYKDDGHHTRKYHEEDIDDMDEAPMFYEDLPWQGVEPLFIWDPVRVGFERIIEVKPGRTVKLVTAAVNPKVFLIENFLSDEEVDHIIAKAKSFGLSSSTVHIDTKIKADTQEVQGKAKGLLQYISNWDHDSDGRVVVSEVIKTAQWQVKLYLNESEVMEMFRQLRITEMDDGIITSEEFRRLNTAGLAEYMQNLRTNHPRFRDRFSEQIWLKHNDVGDKILYNLREKVIKITNLPRYIVEGGEPLQVLRYQPYGHYHAHFDGQDPQEYPDKACCHLDLAAQPHNCRLCRLLTIIYYLNDVEGGGETAFPVADMDNYVEKEFRRRRKGDLYNLSEFCHNSTLVVKPKKGRAVMFYNHYLDDKGFLGALDQYSLHGGCDITKGEKWMANNWITAPPAKFADQESLYSFIDAEGAF